MKHSKTNLAALFICLSLATTALAQSPLNIVGYYNVTLQPGDNLIANQLLQQQTDNSLNNVLIGGVLAGSTFTKWDPINNQFLLPSVFNGHTWSINYDWNPVDGMGGVIHSPGPATNNAFVGEVYQSPGHSLGDPLFGFWDGAPRGPGVYLLADQIPIQATFTMVVGRDPLDGDSVRTLDPLSQTYSVTTFQQGIGWDNGVPSLAVGQAAFFTLVPEPSVVALAGLVSLLLLRRRRGSS